MNNRLSAVGVFPLPIFFGKFLIKPIDFVDNRVYNINRTKSVVFIVPLNSAEYGI